MKLKEIKRLSRLTRKIKAVYPEALQITDILDREKGIWFCSLSVPGSFAFSKDKQPSKALKKSWRKVKRRMNKRQKKESKES